MRRVLLANNTKLLRARPTVVVALPEIQAQVPPLWKAIVVLERSRVHGAR
jgi:hypothetical protein